MSYGKTCERKTGSSISPVTADNQELLVPAVRAPCLCQQLLPPACSPTPQTAFPVILVKVWAEGLCWWVNTAELHCRERNFLSTKRILQGKKKKKKLKSRDQRKLHSSAWEMLLSSDTFWHNRIVQGLSFWWPILGIQRHYNTFAINFLFLEEEKFQLPFGIGCIFYTILLYPIPLLLYIHGSKGVFSSALFYLLIIICCAIKYEWGLWPEDFYMAVQVLTTFENPRCCTNNSNIISGISCHLINVRRLSIASMIYGCENTEWFVK